MATVKYYRQSELCYSYRRRYRNISSFNAINQETQNSNLIGDGVLTSVKTAKANLCDYVTIDNTRWFVIGFEYLNGGQIKLYLQRDVVGEFGIDNFYGKIERGYTDTFIKYRKELSLNQRLVSRTAVKPSSYTYGSYTVSNHNDEMWGILYFSKPSGQSSNIEIPTIGYQANIYNYNYIANNTTKFYELTESKLRVKVNTKVKLGEQYRAYRLEFFFAGTPLYRYVRLDTIPSMRYDISCSGGYWDDVLNAICSNVLSSLVQSGSGYSLPSEENVDTSAIPYNDIVISHENNGSIEYLKYTTVEGVQTIYGSTSITALKSTVRTAISNVSYTNSVELIDNPFAEISSYCIYKKYTYYYEDVTTQVSSGQITIDASKLFVDEPYFICVIPLYDVVITKGVDTYNVDKNIALNLFNNIILQKSGENGILVDAQIYPYCPDLLSVNTSLTYQNGETTETIPVFNIYSTSFIRNCSLTLQVNTDVKKEYIESEFSIVTPANTSKFTFNFYDYYNSGSSINLKIKTALKPFNIISSVVITPSNDSLIGITYNSDLRGCSSSGSEFECSLASNAYETYVRQNSNYQQLFALDKQELQYQHQVEKINEITQAVLNTTTATTMGAIGGTALSGAMGAATGVGAVAGGAAAGATVGSAMALQVYQNNQIREYEERLQQQRFDLTIGTIKNLPNSINRISSFNEIVMQDFYYVIERYECSDAEKSLVDDFIDNYGYSIGAYGFFSSFKRNEGFIKGSLIKSDLIPSLHNIASKEMAGGIYIYE